MGSSVKLGPVVGVVVLVGIAAIPLYSITRVASIMALCYYGSMQSTTKHVSFFYLVFNLLVLNHPQYLLIILFNNFKLTPYSALTSI